MIIFWSACSLISNCELLRKNVICLVWYWYTCMWVICIVNCQKSRWETLSFHLCYLGCRPSKNSSYKYTILSFLTFRLAHPLFYWFCCRCFAFIVDAILLWLYNDAYSFSIKFLFEMCMNNLYDSWLEDLLWFNNALWFHQVVYLIL